MICFAVALAGQAHRLQCSAWLELVWPQERHDQE